MSDGTAAGAGGDKMPGSSPTSRFRIDERYIAPIFITLILVGGQLSFGILESYSKTAIAIVTSIAMEMLLGRMFSGKWPHLASAYISGISIGILVRSTDIWPYALCAAIAITSKYVIRLNGRHLWNPSNLGIVCLLILAPRYASTLSIQWDNSVPAMVVIWILGSVIIYRLKRFHICATYAVSFVGYAFVRHLVTHDTFLAEVAPITGPMYQLFIFFMITDPKTTVKSKKGQMLVAFLIATAENFLRLPIDTNEVVASHAPYFALTLVGPISNAIEIRHNARMSAAKPKLKVSPSSPTA